MKYISEPSSEYTINDRNLLEEWASVAVVAVAARDQVGLLVAATAVEPDPMNLIDLATNHNSLCCVGQKFLCALYSVWHGWL